jgi:hypothetical protein
LHGLVLKLNETHDGIIANREFSIVYSRGWNGCSSWGKSF